ncbi:DNA cytosine methyltransferase [Shewanella eurypsychrophilus]|uniref:Cytosine-specific methyltransferase n=1 Tax=Shewanella eurypsychrophilus TaxID=2593656 RepID=A0ABX6VC48_9GAMM|nr:MULTISPECIES: DNA cytosine methyltransferase [Shewanella]QFU25095.1 DNA (cytosine-5-)-methyltransferase [Shewanella sp. YLB-09]QPG60267.1 DNA cytosine methyltransferase [Shewanella eurypsychrophilus]
MSTRVSIKEASLFLGFSEQRIRTLCRFKAIAAEKIGSIWVINKRSMEKYSESMKHIIAEDHPAYNVGQQLKPIALSFFSGAMGLDLGIEKAGFDIRLACEVDKYCRQTIAINRPNTALLSDINDYEASDIKNAARLTNEDIDLIVGGPPCQAFSTAGKRKGFNDDRGNAFLKFLQLSIDLNPKYIVLENVRGLLSCPMEHRPHEHRGEGYPDLSEDELKGGALNFALKMLDKSGYGYSFELYNSANFGTSQTRERVIIICSRNGQTPPFLTPSHSDNPKFGLPQWNTLKQCISNIDKHDHLNFPEKRLKYYRLLKSGQNWKNLPVDLQKEAMGKSYFSGGGKTGFLRRLSWDKPSPTLVTHPAMPATDLGHPVESRPLSIQEYKRIQQFPDDWKLAGPLIQQYKQVGNAVPIGLGYAVGKHIQDLLESIEIKNIPSFKYSRYKNTSSKEWKIQFNIAKEKLLKNI